MSADVAKGVRHQLLHSRHKTISIDTILKIATEVNKRRGQSARPPQCVSEKKLASLAKDIFQYILKICPLGRSAKYCTALACVLVNMMQFGKTYNNVVLIPKVSWVAQHAPTEIQYGKICHVACRTMSIKTRALTQQFTTANGDVQLMYKFILSESSK